MPSENLSAPALPIPHLICRPAAPARSWRVLVPDVSGLGATWDIERVATEFDRPASVLRFFASGSAVSEPPSVAFGFSSTGRWRGRPTSSGPDQGVWVGLELDRPAVITSMVVHPSTTGSRPCTGIVQRFDGTEWVTTHVGRLEGRHASALVRTPNASAPIAARGWRLSSAEDWVGRWAVPRIRLLTPLGEVAGTTSASRSRSGRAPGDHAPENAFRDDQTCWVGLPDRSGRTWIQIESAAVESVRRILLAQKADAAVGSVDIEYRVSPDGPWAHYGYADQLGPELTELAPTRQSIPPDPGPALRRERAAARPVAVHSNLQDDWRILVVVDGSEKLAETVRDALALAAYPEFLRFETHAPATDRLQLESELATWKDDPRFSLVADHEDAGSFVNSRSFHDGEPYLLRIGSDCAFTPRWDVACIQALESLADELPMLTVASGSELLVHSRGFFTRGSFCQSVPFDPIDPRDHDPEATTVRARTSGFVVRRFDDPPFRVPAELPGEGCRPDAKSMSPFGPIVSADAVRLAMAHERDTDTDQPQTVRVPLDRGMLIEGEYVAIDISLVSMDGLELDRRTVRSPAVLNGEASHVDLHGVTDPQLIAGYVLSPFAAGHQPGPVQVHPLFGSHDPRETR